MSKLFGGNGKVETAMDTLIGKQTEIQGDVRFSGGLHVDGKIKGKVIAEPGAKAASLSISESGYVEGDVRVPNIVLNGRVSGDVYASEKIHLAAKARVAGNVYYKVIQMEAGAEINGQMLRDSGQAAITHEPAAGAASELDELRELRRVK